MRIKHSKFKNTGILFELLVRQIASDTVSNKDSAAIDLVKKYPKLVKRLKRRGKRVLVWTVNSPDQIALCHEAGIDGLITNFPKRARVNG